MLIAFPVLPLLASTMVSPGRSSPSRSARSIMYFAMRALIDPEGLRYSSLTQIPSTMTSGVSPIASRIVLAPRLLVACMPAPSVAGRRFGPVLHRSTFPADGRRCKGRPGRYGVRLLSIWSKSPRPLELPPPPAHCHMSAYLLARVIPPKKRAQVAEALPVRHQPAGGWARLLVKDS